MLYEVITMHLKMVDVGEVEFDDVFVGSEINTHSFSRRSADAGDQRRSSRCEIIGVITSYSIHYTKLYDEASANFYLRGFTLNLKKFDDRNRFIGESRLKRIQRFGSENRSNKFMVTYRQ